VNAGASSAKNSRSRHGASEDSQTVVETLKEHEIGQTTITTSRPERIAVSNQRFWHDDDVFRARAEQHNPRRQHVLREVEPTLRAFAGPIRRADEVANRTVKG